MVVPALLLATLGVLTVVLAQVKQYAQAELLRAATLRANDDLYAALNRLTGLARFEDPAFRDRLQLAQQAGRGAPTQLLDTGLGTAQGALTISGFLGTLLAIAPWMAVAVGLAAVPAWRAELAISRRRAETLWRTSTSARREIFYSQLLTGLPAAKEIRLFGLGRFFRTRMLDDLRVVQAGNRRMDRRELRTQSLLGLLSAAVAGTGLVWAVQSARTGALTIGDVSVFIAAVAGIQTALNGVVRATASGHQTLLVFDHYQAIVGAGPDLPMATDPKPVGPLRHGIELRDVWFRYSDEHPWVLRGVNLTIPRGGSVGLVGLNGAGKSTLVKLLCRLYDPVRGSIHWDGVDLRDLPVEALRARIGAVFQDFMAYDLTAAENIAAGDIAALDDRPAVRAAAREAGADSLVEGLPAGYDTMLTRLFFSHAEKDDPATGVFLSGGQWQRIALARAFLRRDIDLLILDEPSADLDAEAEHDLHQRLRRHRDGRTSVLISHRLNTLRDADLLVVLSGGRIVERGTHEELLAAGGHYAQLFRLQARGYDPVATG